MTGSTVEWPVWDLSDRRPTVLMVTLALPVANPPHAGGRYVHRLCEELSKHAQVVVVAPDGPANREAAAREGTPSSFILLGDARESTGSERWGYRVVHRMQPLLRRLDPSSVYLPMLYDLAHVPELRALLSSADVIDLQWPDRAKAAPWFRRRNPGARIVSTFHDVLTQRYERVSRHSVGWPRVRNRVSARVQRVLERRGGQASDVAVCFSEKDAGLLRRLGVGGEVRVVDPPLAAGEDRSWTPPESPIVSFVSYLAREENMDAARWLLSEIWPLVLEEIPAAELMVVGGGANGHLTTLVRETPRASLTGFVDDLGAAYTQSSVVVVPLRLGAGVKFKVVEALLAGVPVVTTSVGAEGIGHADLFAGLTDDAAAFAKHVVHALTSPDIASTQRAQRMSAIKYGEARFKKVVRDIYFDE